MREPRGKHTNTRILLSVHMKKRVFVLLSEVDILALRLPFGITFGFIGVRRQFGVSTVLGYVLWLLTVLHCCPWLRYFTHCVECPCCWKCREKEITAWNHKCLNNTVSLSLSKSVLVLRRTTVCLLCLKANYVMFIFWREKHVNIFPCRFFKLCS